MKHAPTRSFAVPVLSVAAMLYATSALATGVPAGTLIENTATASFTTGGSLESVDSNTVTIRVDEVLDVATAWQDAGAVPITGSAVLTFSVTNTGNGDERFVLTADPSVAGNDFNVTVDNLAIDTNNNGVYDAGDTIIANGGTSPLIAPDATITVFVLVTAPAGTADGDTSQLNLLAEALTGTGAPGTVFAGAGAGGGDAVAGASGADDDAVGSLEAAVASVSLVKTSSVTDPFGGTQPVPGATITYTLVATVNGTSTVNDLAITDAYPASTSYDPGSLTLDSGPLTDAADADAGEADATGITVDLGDVAAGGSHTITFDVVID